MPYPSPDLTRRPRTKRIFTEADMIRLRDLYYDRDTPLPRVGDAFGVPVSTLLRWIGEMDWPKRSAQPLPVDAGRDLYVVAEAAKRAEAAAPARRKAGPPQKTDPGDLSADVGRAARAELDALAREPEPRTLLERRRRAGILDMLSRAVARMERVDERRHQSFERMVSDMEALARSMTKPAAKAAPKRPALSYPPYGVSALPDKDWWKGR